MEWEVVISAAGIILTLMVSLWRMHVSQTRRIDQMGGRIDQLQRDMVGHIDQLRHEIRGDIRDVRGEISETNKQMQEFATELRNGQQVLTEAVAKVDSRISRLEGMLQPRPWVEAPHDPAVQA